jgi:hypothetical protein
VYINLLNSIIFLENSMTEEDMTKLLQIISEKASQKFGIDLNGRNPQIVQSMDNGMGVLYQPKGSSDDYVLVWCKRTPSGPEILNHNTGNQYAINGILMKLDGAKRS